MRYFIYIILGIVSFSQMAEAADKTDGLSSAIAVERILCKPAMAYTPSSDVTYKPGVDVNGNPVATADLNAAPSQVPMQAHYTEVPLNIDLARKLNISRPAEAQMTVASLRIYDDGRVLYNGQDITQQANVVCGRTTASVPPTPAAPPREVNTMQMPEVPMPGTAAPSSTTPAK